MRKLLFALTALAVLLIPAAVFAQEEGEIEEPKLITAPVEEEEESTEEVTDPTKPLYFFTTLLEEIDVFFTFDDDIKIEKRLEYAEKRISEMALMAEQGNEAELEKVRARYERQIAQALKIANKHSEMAQEKAEKIEAQRAKHLEVLGKVYNQVPEEAKPSIEKVIEKTNARYEKDKAERQALKNVDKGNSNRGNDQEE